MKLSKRYLVIVGIFLALNLALYIPGMMEENLLQIIGNSAAIFYSAIAALGLFIACRSFRVYDFTKIAWILILFGIIFDVIAESLYLRADLIYKEQITEVFPTIADLFWYLAYPPQIIALLMIFRGYRRSGFPMGNKKIYAYISAFIILLFSIVSYYLLTPILQDAETSSFDKFIYVAYSIIDIFIVLFCTILLYITSLYGIGAISKPWKYLTIGYVFITSADLLYSYLSWNNVYLRGNIIDTLWNFGYAAIGLSGIFQYELVSSFYNDEENASN